MGPTIINCGIFSNFLNIYFLSFFWLFHSLLNPLYSQVVNDDYQAAIELEPEQEYPSRTDHCTVQWDCVDEKLTGKCVEYHNDQWFYFNSGERKQLFLNVFNQSCRDLFGVQLIVFKGIPCQTETYEILNCISTACQDDIHLKLEGLEPHQDYWVIVDGYLHDYCRFTIQTSEKPAGFSIEPVREIDSQTNPEANRFKISWSTNDSLSQLLSGFRIFRKKADAFSYDLVVGEVELRRDAYGRFIHDYEFTDSIREPGKYRYLLAAIDQDGALFKIREVPFQVKAPLEYKLLPVPVFLKLRYPEGNPIRISVFNQKDQLIEQMEFNFDSNRHHLLKLDNIKYFEQGVFRLKVIAEDLKTGKITTEFFTLAETIDGYH
jgi:hypothetical protein